MAKMLAYCGIDCSECPAYLAHTRNDQALREKTAPEWSKAYGFDFKPSDINCVGCTATIGVHIKHCAECEFRSCGQARAVANCGRCSDYPCAKIAKFHEMVPPAKQNLDAEQAQAKK
jgi:hypothetical protein